MPQGEGCEQGDPLAPAPFALGQHDSLARAAASLNPQDNLLAFLDDLYVVTVPSRARASLDGVTSTVDEGCGIASNLGKTHAIGAFAGGAPPGIAELGAEVWRGDRPPHERGMIVLGSPVGRLRVRLGSALLGVPDAAEDCWCPRCDGILDRYNHHAGVCVAGGERTQRHNAVRDLVYTWADRAGLHPEKKKKERQGLLLPPTPEDTHVARRRPADVYVPALAGSPAALDFAITAPQRQEILAMSSQHTAAAAAAYARHKEVHLDTAKQCEAQGIVFVPMVAEVTGTWDAGAAIVLKHIAHAVAARSGEDPGSTHSTLLLQMQAVSLAPNRSALFLHLHLSTAYHVAWTFRVYLALPFCLLFKRFNSHIQFVGFRFKAKFMA